ncbi:MAG: amidohydrolase [Chloroflexota bacterium]
MLAIKNGKLLTITNGTIDGGTILVDNGKITKVGKDVEIPAGAQVIDATGNYVMPGVMDAHAHVAIWEESIGWEGDDVNELTDPLTPQVRAIDGINPEDQGFKDAIQGGVTGIWCAPGSGNVIGGEGVTMRTYGATMDEMIIKNFSGLKAAFGENPKRVYSNQKKMPSTRMGTAAVMREALIKTLNYMKKIEKANGDPEKMPDRDFRLEGIARVLKREIPMRTHAHRADDILTALRIAREFDFDMTIEHCTEGHKIVDKLAEWNIMCAVGPSFGHRAKVELKDKSWATPGILANAGVRVSLITDHPIIPIQYLPLMAGFAVKYGMKEEDAFKALTINPATMAGVGDRFGSLEVGKEADIAIFDGHPFEIKTHCLYTIVKGEVVHKL